MHPRNAHRHPNKKCDWTRQQIARAARPRSSLWRPTRTSRTPSCRARALNVLSRRDRGQSRNRTRQRSCGALKEHTVSACEQAARVRSAAAHRVPRRCPATAGPPSEALKDRGPAKQRGPQRWRCTDLRPDTPAGQNLSTMTVGKGTLRGCKAQDWGIRACASYLYQSRPTTLQTLARQTGGDHSTHLH